MCASSRRSEHQGPLPCDEAQSSFLQNTEATSRFNTYKENSLSPTIGSFTMKAYRALPACSKSIVCCLCGLAFLKCAYGLHLWLYGQWNGVILGSLLHAQLISQALFKETSNSIPPPKSPELLFRESNWPEGLEPAQQLQQRRSPSHPPTGKLQALSVAPERWIGCQYCSSQRYYMNFDITI